MYLLNGLTRITLAAGLVLLRPQTHVQVRCNKHAAGRKQRGPYPKIGTTEVRYCQTCSTPPGGSGLLDCKPKQVQLVAPPNAGETVLQDDGIAEQPKQPLLGSRNDADVPPTGNIE